jgi:hypothetical protein
MMQSKKTPFTIAVVVYGQKEHIVDIASPQSAYKPNVKPIKMPTAFFMEHDKPIPNLQENKQ